MVGERTNQYMSRVTKEEWAVRGAKVNSQIQKTIREDKLGNLQKSRQEMVISLITVIKVMKVLRFSVCSTGSSMSYLKLECERKRQEMDDGEENLKDMVPDSFLLLLF